MNDSAAGSVTGNEAESKPSAAVATDKPNKKVAKLPAKKNGSIKSFFKAKTTSSIASPPTAAAITSKTSQLIASPGKSRPSNHCHATAAAATVYIKSPTKPTLPAGAMECTFPCPEIGDGWTQKIVKRKKDNSGISSDRYFFSPTDGKKFRSMVEVNRYLNGNVSTTATKPLTSKSQPADPSSKMETSPKKSKTPKYPVGTILSKMFHDDDIGKERAFSGKVVKYDPNRGLYWVKYEDSDEEELSEKKLSDIIDGQRELLPKYPLGTPVSKMFHDDDLGKDRAFSGKVMEYDSTRDLYSITYEDGDEEELSEKELRMIVVEDAVNNNIRQNEDNGVLSKKKQIQVKRKTKSPGSQDSDEENHATMTKKRRASGETQSEDEKKDALEMLMSKTPRRSAKKKIVYAEDSDLDDEEFDGSVDVALPKKEAKKKSSVGTKKTKVNKDKKKRIIDSDSDEFELGQEGEDEDESFAVDSESDMEVTSEAGYEEAPKHRNRKKSPSTKKISSTTAESKKNGESKSATSKKGGVQAPDSIEALCAAKAKDIKLLNNPQQFPDEGPYVEPVGIDATDGIVEGIIGRMVQKVGKLLLKTIKRNDAERELGELSFPIKLNTACSGTDAPSIALGLVKESLDRFCSLETKSDGKSNSESCDIDKEHGFDYEHNMSCEIEPFKQAYIGRNFPGVLLFPDITKLTEKETVVDVYGRAQKIPKGNIFVAGTSCKDFSMLKSSHRKDIEDKGTSGETFLAAVEYLEQEKPDIAIFENVDKAPWEKMQEYIQGRLHLKERNSIKNITDIKKNQADADNDLKFSVNEDGRYVVEAVPRQVGVRAGCIVQGFVPAYDNPCNVRPLRAKTSDKNKVYTLGELAKEHGINLEEDILVMEKQARYCTHLIRLDTKHYGLPQTRNRQYLFVWRSDDPSDNLGEYFQLLMDHLKTPLLHSMEAFMLPPTHDRIRCFREALRSGPGLMVAKERAKELDFFDWELSGVKDLAHHLNYRKMMGINERSRWLTQWDTRGRKVAPGLWPELVAMWNHRRCDLIDCFSAAAVRDAVSRDPLHHLFTWDLSQNVHRTSVRTPTVGVSGCVTPGGELLLPHKGRTMMGFEKLLLQGIPFTRLALGPETEVQLSDLAGNAMSMPVVCATLLSAICAPQLRREQSRIEKVNLNNYRLIQKYESANGSVLAERGDLCGKKLSSNDFIDVFTAIADEFVESAYECSVLCNCESSGQTAQDETILECTSCGFGVCHTCTSLHQIDSHHLKEITISGKKRVNPHEFEMKLRCAAPSILVLGDSWETTIPDCTGLESYSFQLQRVDRMRGSWLLTYGAWEDHGSGRQVAEIRISLGQVGALDKDLGLVVYVKCFAPAIRLQNPQRGLLEDVARLVLKRNGKLIDTSQTIWEIRAKASKVKLNVVGSDSCDSHRVQIGLNDIAAKELKNHKPQNKFMKSFPKSRNDLLSYHPKWKHWPETIIISGDVSNLVNGIYKKMTCQHTTVLSALWRRSPTENLPALYIYIRPDVLRSALDVAVVSKTPSYRDRMELCELIDWIPENALAEETHITEANFINWRAAPNLKIKIPSPTMTMEKGAKQFIDQVSSAISEPPILCELVGLSHDHISSILQHTTDACTKDIVALDLVGKMGSRNAKRLSILAAPLLLKYAAEGMLPLKLLHWYKLSHPNDCSFGMCESCSPSRPQEIWIEVEVNARGKKLTRYEREFDAEESNEFYHKLLQRPSVFGVYVDKENGKLIIRMNPVVAGHQAAAHLVRGRGLKENFARSINVEYCLSELSRMGEPMTKEFHVPNSDVYKETSVDGMEFSLYPRQAKALTRMLAIEGREVEFNEEERSEHILNGVGWCLIGRATRVSPLKGGVLGDAIGSGKTVVTIALILKGVTKARENRCIANGRSGATLIVVPPGLVKQWDDERKKFTKHQLKSIIIDSTDTLKRYCVKDICEADMVIVPAGIIEERGKTATSRPYTELLSSKANAKQIPTAPSNGHKEAPTIEGTWVRNMASGPAIYVGNDCRQKHRDEQAFYGHRYSEAISMLRQKKFCSSERGVPLEWFTWERIVVDECHECLVSTARQDQESKASEFKAQARRGAREFLGVGCTNKSTRPLLAETAVWGLTGTPLLETEARVTELANLMGGTYLTGSAHHWRKEERESGRDIFLNQQEEGSKSREYRCAVQDSCHSYVREACQRNRGEELVVTLERKKNIVRMSPSEGDLFLSAIKEANLESYSITPDQLGEKAGNGLTVTSSSTARHSALLEIIDSIQSDQPHTKIIIFANAIYSGYNSALEGLKSSGRKFSHVDESHTVMEQNEIISWFRHQDASAEDKLRPRILLLSYNQAAGHNLQEDCHNVIMYDPMYSGSDAVADASVEEQALGRVMRQGQKNNVSCYRIIVRGPNGERCLDDVVVERNLDEDVLRAATSNFD